MAQTKQKGRRKREDAFTNMLPVRMPRGIYQALREQAELEGMTMAGLARKIIRRALAKSEAAA